MHYRDDVDTIDKHAIDDAVTALDQLAYVVAGVIRHATAGVREVGEAPLPLLVGSVAASALVAPVPYTSSANVWPTERP
jgi:hypothetical protein